MAKLENVIVQLPDEVIIKYKWVSDFLVGQKDTESIFQTSWQAYRFLLKGKMYAYIGVEDKSGRPILTLKLEPTYSDMLRNQFSDIVPGYYMNKELWSTVFLDGNIPKDVIEHMIASSYQEIIKTFSKKMQK